MPKTNQVRIIWRGNEVWRFYPHRIRPAECEIVTPRHLDQPPAPIGSEIEIDGEHVGTIRCTRKETFNRFTLVYDPVPQETATQEDTEQEQEEAPSGTPIAAMEEHVSTRIYNILQETASTVEELSDLNDEALQAIDGVGPASLIDIREAITAVLNK